MAKTDWGKLSSKHFSKLRTALVTISTQKATYSPGLEAYYRPGEQLKPDWSVFYDELNRCGSELEYSLGIVLELA